MQTSSRPPSAETFTRISERVDPWVARPRVVVMSPTYGGWGGRYVWRQPYGETRPSRILLRSPASD